jgi:hypothetical protein
VLGQERELVQALEQRLEQVLVQVEEERLRHRNLEQRLLESRSYHASIGRNCSSKPRQSCSSSYGFPVHRRQ